MLAKRGHIGRPFYLPCGHYACCSCAPYSSKQLRQKLEIENVLDRYDSEVQTTDKTFKGHKCVGLMCNDIDPQFGYYKNHQIPEERCITCTAVVNYTDLKEVNEEDVPDWKLCFFALKSENMRYKKQRKTPYSLYPERNDVCQCSESDENDFGKSCEKLSSFDENESNEYDQHCNRPDFGNASGSTANRKCDKQCPGPIDDSFIWGRMKEVVATYKNGRLPSIQSEVNRYITEDGYAETVALGQNCHPYLMGGNSKAANLYRYVKTLYAIAARMKEPALLGNGLPCLPCLNILTLNGDAAVRYNENFFTYDKHGPSWDGMSVHVLYRDFSVDLLDLLSSAIPADLSDEWKQFLYLRQDNNFHWIRGQKLKTLVKRYPFLLLFLVQAEVCDYTCIAKVLGQYMLYQDFPQVIQDLVESVTMDVKSGTTIEFRAIKVCMYALTFSKKIMLDNPRKYQSFLARFCRFTVDFFVCVCRTFPCLLMQSDHVNDVSMLIDLPMKKEHCVKFCLDCDTCFTIIPYIFSKFEHISSENESALKKLWSKMDKAYPGRGLKELAEGLKME